MRTRLLRALTIVETALVVSISGIVIVGAVLLYQNLSTSIEAAALEREMRVYVDAVRTFGIDNLPDDGWWEGPSQILRSELLGPGYGTVTGAGPDPVRIGGRYRIGTRRVSTTLVANEADDFHLPAGRAFLITIGTPRVPIVDVPECVRLASADFALRSMVNVRVMHTWNGNPGETTQIHQTGNEPLLPVLRLHSNPALLWVTPWEGAPIGDARALATQNLGRVTAVCEGAVNAGGALVLLGFRHR